MKKKNEEGEKHNKKKKTVKRKTMTDARTNTNTFIVQK
jgi:hypothetical protein